MGGGIFANPVCFGVMPYIKKKHGKVEIVKNIIEEGINRMFRL